MNVRSSPSRALPFLFALLLLLLQSAAPLLHAHAADDPRAVVLSGLHLPGLETVAVPAGARDVVAERTYPLIEETECCRQRHAPDAFVAPTIRAPFPRVDAAMARAPSGPVALHATFHAAPPPPRAPPTALPV